MALGGARVRPTDRTVLLRSSQARHDDEYPSPMAPERTERELRALTLDSARLINEARKVAGLEPVDGIVPTGALLGERPERRPGN